MTRVKRFAASIFSGYAAMGANVVYTLVSVPLALYYLNTEQFGLWALVAQIGGFLALVDLGMSPAVARLLGDHKDDRNGGDYGSVIKTSFVVAVFQALIVAVLGAVLAPLLVELMGIPSHLRHDFVWLLFGQAVLQGITMIARPVASPLWCHQRQDVTNYANLGLFALLFVTMWIGFKAGLGIWTMLWTSGIGVLYTLSFSLGAVLKLKLLPDAGCWGHIERERFVEIFNFSRDVFLLSLGSQLVSASQVIVISRFLGLEAAAAWSVGSKMFMLAQQVVWRIYDFSAPVLTEMFVRGEKERFYRRFRDIVAMTAAVAALFSILGSFSNADFVRLWTHGKVEWRHGYDVLLGILLFVGSVSRCHTGLVGVTKQIHGMRYVYLLEGVAFIALALVTLKSYGIGGIIASSIFANIICSGLYGCWRSARLFGMKTGEVFLVWIKGPLAFYVSLMIFSILITQLTGGLQKGTRFIVEGSIISLAAFGFFWKLSLPVGLRDEVMTKISNYFKIWNRLGKF